MKKKISKIIVLLFVALSAGLILFSDLQKYLAFEYLKSGLQVFQSYYADHPFLTIALYMLVYIAVTALSLPGAAVMSLAGGAIFGFRAGVITVSFASSIGATLAFVTARFLLGDYIQEKFGDRLRLVNEGMKKDGAFYLFTLRLVPVFPFFVVNLVMALTPVKTGVFYLVSQAGMLPATFVFINAGTRLGEIESPAGILSASLIFSFALLGFFPLVAKKTVDFFAARKIYAKYPQPKKYDYNLVAIGAGAAGLVSSYTAAVLKAKAAIVEKHRMGGDCLNTGCIPSKALIRSAKILSYLKRAEEFGFKSGKMEFDFADVMERVQSVIRKIGVHDSEERYTALGVECIKGDARIVSPFEVEVNGRILTTKNIVIATGARPFVPKIPGMEKIEYLTSDNIWNLRQLPKRLAILGGGPVGCELAQAFCRLGSEVTVVEMLSVLMSKEDPEVSCFIGKKFESEGIRIMAGHRVEEIRTDAGENILVCGFNGVETLVAFDRIFLALGRVANIEGFGLEELGIEISGGKTVKTDEFMRTNFPNIYCAGDVTGPYQFTHTAAHQAWHASVNALFGGFKSFRADYGVIPRATYTDPEVARVGLNETEAVEKGIPYEVTRYGIDDLDRAVTDSEDYGFVKILTKPGSDRILGVTIVGNHASDIIAEYVFAMRHGLGLNKILATIHIYPTMAEANKYAAGEWKKAHAPAWILKLLKKFHEWRLG